MLLHKEQIKPDINSHHLLCEQTGKSFCLLANTKPHLCTVSWLQTGLCWWDLSVFQCIHSNPLAQLVNDVAARLTMSCTSKEEKLFLEGRARALNESFIHCKT